MGLENWAWAGCASVTAVKPVKAMRVAVFMRLLHLCAICCTILGNAFNLLWPRVRRDTVKFTQP
jgi:hypothetical protein